MSHQIRIFSLSTCSHCKATKKFLTDNGLPYDYNDVDLLTGDERKAALAEVARYNPNRTFPTLLIDDQVLVGFNEKKIRAALGLP
ncbi:MAG TPA: glutaredoxin family protein [Syntrophus sp. (in: bacteria)]|jgi:glutaredoxin|nr:glutaredoxin family protein [Syntrophus sp. (in: bacteria)]